MTYSICKDQTATERQSTHNLLSYCAGEQLSSEVDSRLLEDVMAKVKGSPQRAENKWKKARRRKLTQKSTLRKGSSEELGEFSAVQRVEEQVRTVGGPKKPERRAGRRHTDPKESQERQKKRLLGLALRTLVILK